MNKKEEAAFKALTEERDMYRSMVISPPVDPDVMPPKNVYGEQGFERGWLPHWYSGSSYISAQKAAVKAGSHRIGEYAWESGRGSWSQRSIKLYSLRANALRQARHEASTAYAKQLAAVDREIAKAEAGDSDGNL